MEDPPNSTCAPSTQNTLASPSTPDLMADGTHSAHFQQVASERLHSVLAKCTADLEEALEDIIRAHEVQLAASRSEERASDAMPWAAPTSLAGVAPVIQQESAVEECAAPANGQGCEGQLKEGLLPGSLPAASTDEAVHSVHEPPHLLKRNSRMSVRLGIPPSKDDSPWASAEGEQKAAVRVDEPTHLLKRNSRISVHLGIPPSKDDSSWTSAECDKKVSSSDGLTPREEQPKRGSFSQRYFSRQSFSAGIISRRNRIVSEREPFGESSAPLSEAATYHQGDPLEVLPVWTQMQRKTSSIGFKRAMTFDLLQEDDAESRHPQYSLRVFIWLQRCVLQPSCLKRLLWDLTGCLFILYDVAMIPLQAFDLPDTTFFKVIQWFTRVFWTLDMPSTLLTGFMLTDGSVVMKLDKIAVRYAKSWLLLDVVVVFVDWVDVFMLGVGQVSAARMGKTMRIVRMLRLIRLLRMAKLPFIAGTLIETYIRSERVMLIASMVKLLCLIVGLMHFIACFWWGIGTSAPSTSTWVGQSGISEENFAYKYATSFHWSLTQFTGTMELNPVNLVERAFAILVLLFAFVVSAAFISSITSSMTRLQMITGNKSEMFAALRIFLEENKISRRLTARLERNAHHAYQEFERSTPETEIELLKLVSEPLRVELHYELYNKPLSVNPFFQQYQEVNPAAVRRICHSAVSTMFLAAGDIVFVDGEAPRIPQMYFVLRGTLSYRHENQSLQKIVHGAWISEPVLWCSWIHCGLLRADIDAQLLVLDGTGFQSIAPQLPIKTFQVGTYAVEFVNTLNNLLVQGLLSDIDELSVSQKTVQKAYPELMDSATGLPKSVTRAQSKNLALTSSRGTTWFSLMGHASQKPNVDIDGRAEQSEDSGSPRSS